MQWLAVVIVVVSSSAVGALLPSLNSCSAKMLEHLKNPLPLLQINGFILNSQFDELMAYGMDTAKQVCGDASTKEMETLLGQHSESISIIKELLGLVSPQEREQLKDWILTDQKWAISGFMMQKAMQFAFNPQVSSKIFKLMTTFPLVPLQNLH